MSFGSIEFLFIFLPFFLLFYCMLLKAGRAGGFLANLALLGVSIWYYFSLGKWNFIIFLALSSINFFLGYAIQICKIKRNNLGRNLNLWLGIIIDVGVLVYFRVMGQPAPVGMSFLSFVMIAYIADVYRYETAASMNLISFLTYSMMFPKIVQGPVTRFGKFRRDLKHRTVHLYKLDRSLKIFFYGLFMKVAIADNISFLWKDLNMIGYESISTPLAWIGMFAYSLQLYFDFAGYSLMAVGLGGMLGFNIPTNFELPYSSKSIGEFYRRWHITLGEWFKTYVYIPLGGNKKGMFRTILNLGIVWILTGLWHGTTVNFVLWSMTLFIFIACEKLFLKKFFGLFKTGILQHLYVLFVIPLTWMEFAINDVSRLKVYFTRLFPFIPHSYASNVNADDWLIYLKQFGWVLALAIILCIPPVHNFFIKIKEKSWSFVLYLFLFIVSVVFISAGVGNTFMYAVF